MANKKHIDDTDYQLREGNEGEQLLDLIMPGDVVEPKEPNKKKTPAADPQDKVSATRAEADDNTQPTPPEDIDPESEDNEEDLDNKTARKKLLTSLTDDEGEKTELGLSFVLGGNILTTKWLREQILWLVMVVVMAFFYVSNRYYAQKQEIHIENLKTELKSSHYDAMARSAQLMRLYRRSTIIEHLNKIPGNTLTMPTKQPAVIPNN